MSKSVAPSLYSRIRDILVSARTGVARTVNTTQVMANWLIGREIVEEEQKGAKRADYGQALLADISRRLARDFGSGGSVRNLEYCRTFYSAYPRLLSSGKSNAVRSISSTVTFPNAPRSISNTLSRKSPNPPPLAEIGYAPRSQSWAPGLLHPNLSWTHYRTLVRIDRPEARSFYEIEAIKNNWSARELERQMASLLYDRLARSRDKKGLLRLATKGQEVARAADAFKDPVVIEFLGLPESPRLVESDLEQALLNNLQTFLLELGRGFAFVARQERITLDGDHFYLDLVFYHTVLKCYVLLDLKVGKLTHGDLGQLQLYVNYYDCERRTAGDQPTLGLILCTDKNDAMVRYTLGPDQEKRIFASRYQLHLPTEKELQTELRRELRQLR